MHWPISNGGASTHFQNFPYFSNAGRYESGWVVSKSNTSCAERMTPGSARITVFRADAIAHALFKACSDFKQDQGEPLGRRGNRSSGGLLRLRLLKAPTISVNGFPAGPLPTCPNRQCLCRDALTTHRWLTYPMIEAFSDVRCRDSAARFRANTHECTTKKDESL